MQLVGVSSFAKSSKQARACSCTIMITSTYSLNKARVVVVSSSHGPRHLHIQQSSANIDAEATPGLRVCRCCLQVVSEVV